MNNSIVDSITISDIKQSQIDVAKNFLPMSIAPTFDVIQQSLALIVMLTDEAYITKE